MRRSRSKGRIHYFLLAVPLLLICLLLFAQSISPPASKVIIIGLDAADWDIINPLVDAGKLPSIGEIISGGTTGKLETVGPDELIIDVALSMLDHKHRRRPVVDEQGNLLGQLTCRQLLKGVKDLDLPEDWREN